LQELGQRHISVVLPVPLHREKTPEICIELYYQDHEIQTLDGEGRRLYLTSEFDKRSGTHCADSTIHCNNLNALRKESLVDDMVFRGTSNLALPKSSFADYVLQKEPHFDKFDFSSFKELFTILAEIAENSLT
jgi:hypothetical protein